MDAKPIRWKDLTFTRIILMLALLLVPLSIVGSLGIRWSYHELSARLLQSVSLQSSNFLVQLQYETEQIHQLELSFLVDGDLNRVAKMPESLSNYERSRAIVRICQRLTVLAQSNEILRAVRAYLPNLGWSLNSDGTSGGNYSEIPPEEVRALVAACEEAGSDLFVYQGQLILPLVMWESEVRELPNCVLVAAFSPEKLRAAWERASVYSRFPYRISAGGYEWSSLPGKDFPILCDETLERLPADPFATTRIGEDTYLAVQESTSNNRFSLLQYLSQEEIQEPLKPLRYFAVIFFCMILAFFLLYLLSAYWMIKRPVNKLLSGFREVERGNYDVRLNSRSKNDFRYLFESFNHMAVELDVLFHEVYEQKLLVQKTELKQLQSQINPHFLYNSYFILRRLIQSGDQEKASWFARNMGQYFQYITRSAADVVPLEKEVRHARIYADIQAMRFEGRIAVEMDDCPAELQSQPVPRLILQPIIENAFEHSLEDKAADGLLQIRVLPRKNGVELRVEDNGGGLDEATLARLQEQLADCRQGQETTALFNIARRIRIFYKNDSALTVERSPLGGLAVCIRIGFAGNTTQKSEVLRDGSAADCGR